MLSADGGNRTPDRRVTKPLLYQLSYISKLKPVGRKCSALLELSDHQASLAFQLPDLEVILIKPFPLVATSGIEPTDLRTKTAGVRFLRTAIAQKMLPNRR